MFLSSYVGICSMLDMLNMIPLMFLKIWKTHVKSEPVVILERAHLSQPKIVHSSGLYILGMSIAGIRACK